LGDQDLTDRIERRPMIECDYDRHRIIGAFASAVGVQKPELD
jgi:hypothetical protein